MNATSETQGLDYWREQLAMWRRIRDISQQPGANSHSSEQAYIDKQERECQSKIDELVAK